MENLHSMFFKCTYYLSYFGHSTVKTYSYSPITCRSIYTETTKHRLSVIKILWINIYSQSWSPN